MKFLKSYENFIENIPKDLEDFIKSYTESYYYKSYSKSDIKSRLDIWGIPEEIAEEFQMLIFLYDYGDYWRKDTYYDDGEGKKYNNKIKNLVKKYTLNSILTKIEETPDIYFQLEKTCEIHKTRNISRAPIIYMFFLLNKAVKLSPEHIKQTQLYNL